MSVYDRYQSALEGRLSAFSGFPYGNVAWENVRFSPPTPTTPWMRASFMPVAAERKALGEDGYSRVDGLFKIWIYYPLGQGSSESSIIADSLIQWFKSGTRLESGGERVTILSASRGQGGIEDAWWVIPVTISWYSHTGKV